MESILNINCSMFANSKVTVPMTVNLLQWLKDPKYLPQQQTVRATVDPDEKRKAKEAMPAITPSGVFAKRGKEYLLSHTSFMAIDIDWKDNHHLSNFVDLKLEISKIPNVAYCGLSVSGSGYWLLIPIAFPDNHKEHFKFIEMYFKSKGIIIDPSCKDIARMRFYSYDSDAYFNHAAKSLKSFYIPQAVKRNEWPQKRFNGKYRDIYEQYNLSGEFKNVLKKHGWKIESTTGCKTFFTRPGKSSGISAEFDTEKNIFFVFTSSTQFEGDKGYNPFQVYARLEHDNNLGKATEALKPSITFEYKPIPKPAIAHPSFMPPDIQLKNDKILKVKIDSIQCIISNIEERGTQPIISRKFQIVNFSFLGLGGKFYVQHPLNPDLFAVYDDPEAYNKRLHIPEYIDRIYAMTDYMQDLEIDIKTLKTIPNHF